MLFLAVTGASILLLGLAFFTMYRPWRSRWGATDEEIALNMPGDEIIRRPTFNVARAITVKARPGGDLAVDRADRVRASGLPQLRPPRQPGEAKRGAHRSRVPGRRSGHVDPDVRESHCGDG